MRHRKKFNHLSRTAPHRKAMLANMASSLIMHKRITTTTAKAKALRTFVEPVITRCKEDSTHSRRMVFKQLRDKEAVTELFREVAVKIADRPGGYTRIIKLGNRLGDNADMCIIELVDYNENLLAEKAAAKPKSGRRRRGGSSKKSETVQGAALSTAAPAEAPAAETEAPAAETQAPAAETEAPAAETEAPAAETEAPAAETTGETKAENEVPPAEVKAGEAPGAEEETEKQENETKAEAPADADGEDEASEDEEKKE